MFSKFEPTAPEATRPVSPEPAGSPAGSLLQQRTIRLGQTLAAAGANLRQVDNALHQAGHHSRPTAQVDEAMQSILVLERAIALDPNIAQSAEAKAILAQARALNPVITDIRTLEATDPELDAPEPVTQITHHMVGDVHESGIVNVTKADPVLASDALKPGVDLVERLEHATHIPVQDYTARMMVPPTGTAPDPAAMLRDIVEVPAGQDDEEDELEAMLTLPDPEMDAPVPE